MVSMADHTNIELPQHRHGHGDVRSRARARPLPPCSPTTPCGGTVCRSCPASWGQTEHKGIEAIRGILAASGRPHPGTGVDSYDLATNRFSDVVVLADGDFVVRQHTQHSTTLGGQPYRNVYCFVFRFNTEGKIQYLTEHWNTWYAHRVLFDNFEMEPAHPLP